VLADHDSNCFKAGLAAHSSDVFGLRYPEATHDLAMPSRGIADAHRSTKDSCIAYASKRVGEVLL
jgi:hypothetical protein